jgi:hypothetical protein
MPRFRKQSPSNSPSAGLPQPLTPGTVREVIEEVFRPAHFFVGAGLSLDWETPVLETVPWEVFRGRLIDPAFTRRRRALEAWSVYVVEASGRSAEPLLSVKLDAAAGEVHVTRAIYCYAWEGYDAGGNVYLSRETRKWVRELVGTLRLARLADAEELRDELVCRLFQAVVGTSRLPLTSLEAPLPAFSLGRLAYCYRPAATPASGPLRSWDELAVVPRETELAAVERAKLLEVLLHATPEAELGRLADLFLGDGASTPSLLQLLFNEVSLSPYTDLADKALALLRVTVSPAERVDCLGRLLRQLGRHLSAYDLVTFHQRGANYPDALLLDALLTAYVELAETRPELFAEGPGLAEPERRARRLRRRALRQAWLLRSWYEGLPVPDAPTSQGEALRVLPEPHPRVSEEQILQPTRRQRRLFADDLLRDRARDRLDPLLRLSVRDLEEPEELRELGTALFLDRPFGVGKAPTEPDATPLFSHEAFSPTLAERRLEYLANQLHLLPTDEATRHLQRLRGGLAVPGIALGALAGTSRPGVVALADARQAAPDFVVVRTTARAVRDFLGLYDFRPLLARFRLDCLAPGRRLLIVAGAGREEPGAVLTVHDPELRPRLELAFDPAAGYESRAGVEFPAGGLRVLRLWEDGDTPGSLREHDLRRDSVVLPVRSSEVRLPACPPVPQVCGLHLPVRPEWAIERAADGTRLGSSEENRAWRCWRCAASSSSTGAARSWTGSTSTSMPARWSACWGRTAPARRRVSA